MHNNWYKKHVLTTEGLLKEDIDRLFDLAKKYKKGTISVAKKNINCLTLFYEPSTRTRLSFECAAHKLGLNILSVSNASNDSSTFKGESLEDTGRILSSYADIVVMRHPIDNSVKELSLKSKIPIINAGDGGGEHPTQALLDLFTIKEAFSFRDLKGLRVGLCGDLLYGRTVHSLIRLLSMYECEIISIAPPEVSLPESFMNCGLKIKSAKDLKGELAHLDVLYMTRIQKERFRSVDEYEKVKSVYKLRREDLKTAPVHLKVLHPLPRLDEIDPDVDNDPRSHYFIQAENGVPVRMALMSLVLGIEK